jgi:hypothetical protein
MSDNPAPARTQLKIIARDLRRVSPNGGGTLLSYFTVWIPDWDLHLHHCKWGRGRGGDDWVGLPQFRWTAPDGKERFVPAVTFGSTGTQRAFYAAMLKAVRELAAKEAGKSA